jgi:hypothetical protein
MLQKEVGQGSNPGWFVGFEISHRFWFSVLIKQ